MLRIAALAAAVGCAGEGTRDDTAFVGHASPNSAPRYNEVRQKSAHNAYAQYEPLFDQLAYHNIRSVELDAHSKRRDRDAAPGDWYVYHYDTGPVLWQHDLATSCERLSDCLGQLRAFHNATPEHEIVTVVLDWKDAFDDDGHGPADLDALLARELDPAWMLTPAALRAACPSAGSLRAAVTGACAWPRLDALRGKFAFVITGGACDEGSTLEVYTNEGRTADAHAAFIAPDLRDDAPFESYVQKPYAIFFNMARSRVTDAARVAEAGFVGRVFGLDDPLAWRAAFTAGAHLLATNKVNADRDPWATTASPGGWPFRCLGACDEPAASATGSIVLRVAASGSDDASDAAGVLVDRVPETESTWSAFVAVPSSHVSDDAQGCLIAREGLGAQDAFFSTCRPADNGGLRIRYRRAQGEHVIEREVGLASARGLAGESPMFLRIALAREGEGTRARGYGSADGAHWFELGDAIIDSPLPMQGIAASSGGNDAVRFVFGNVVRDGRAGSHAYPSPQAFPIVAKVGACTGLEPT